MQPQLIFDAIAAMPEEIRHQAAKKIILPQQAIVFKGEEADHVYILLEGQVRVSNEFASGHRYSFAEYAAPSFIGEYEILAGQPFYATTNEAITPCTVLSLQAESFIHWIQNDASLGLLLARLIAEKSYPTSNENGRFKFLPGIQKLQDYLLRRYEPDNNRLFLLREDRQQIADEIGTSIKTVNRAVAKLKADGLIGLQHGKITLTAEQKSKLQIELDEYF